MKITKEQVPAYGDYYGKGETLTFPGGYSALVRCDYDPAAVAPWDNSDCHGPVSDWTTRAKLPGERVLCEDRGIRRYYDYAEAVRIAKRDGWDAPPYGTGTKGERAARAAAWDFEYLRRWCNDGWHYLGVMVTVYRNGAEVADDSLWRVESEGDYWRETAAEMIDYAISKDRKARAKAAKAARLEAKERNYWACRDVVTA